VGWRISGAVEEFLAAAGEFLRAERARNTVLLTVTEGLRATAASEYSAVRPWFGWWPGRETGTVRGAFIHTPPHPVLLSAMPAEAVAELATELAVAGRALAGVNADETSAQAFAARWRDRTGLDAKVGRRMRLFRLGELSWPAPGPDGDARLATTADRDLLIDWFEAFSQEVNEPTTDDAAAVDDRLSYAGLTIWQAGGVPVSLAGVTRTVAGMVRVGPVYTPAELRGRGYAGAVTASVSQAALDAGTTEVLLYTDLANPTSNALYQRIGYRPVEDRVLLSFG